MSDPLVDQAFADGRVPAGITREYLYETRDSPAIASIIAITVLSSLVVLVRVVSRAFYVRRFGLDDALVAFSWAIFIPFVVLCVRLIQIGSGRHYEYIQHVMSLPTVQASEVWDFVAHLLYTTSLLVCRLSGLSFYHRLCAQHRGFLVTIRAMAVVLAAGYVPQMCLIIFHCLPVTGLWPYDWQPGVEDYTCLPWGVVYSVNSSVSLLCDLLLFGIPIAMLRMLNMPPRQKVQLAGILLPGIGVIAISVARLVLVIQGQWQADMSWSYNPMLIVETTEIGATLIALSVPGVKPVFDRLVLRRPREGGASKVSYYRGASERSGPGSTRLRTLRDTSTGLRSQDDMADAYRAGEDTQTDDKSITSRDGIVVRTDFDLSVQDEATGPDSKRNVRVTSGLT